MLSARLLAFGAMTMASLISMSAGAMADHSWGNYHWGRTANPFELQLGNNVNSSWLVHLSKTSEDWTEGYISADTKTNKQIVLKTKIVAGSTDPKRCRASSGRVEVCNASYGNNGWLGLAQIWLSGGHIVQGVAKLNDSYMAKSPYNTVHWRNLVICQEVAHTFGLGHNDENFSNANKLTCMDYTNSPAGNEQPNDHDFEQLISIYLHSNDTKNTFSTTTAQTRAIPQGGPAWGRPVASNENGVPNVFVKELEVGIKRVTHVFWTLEARRGQHGYHD
jgi:hypothetical protein